MNYWSQLSIEYASQRSYLDDLFHVYPTLPDGIRNIDKAVEKAFASGDNEALIRELFKLKLFPIKDSYVGFLKKDPSSIGRNPKTIKRLCGRLYDLGLEGIYEKCSEPKETNRQMGPRFSNWLNKGVLGVFPVAIDDFLSNEDDAVLSATDDVKKQFAKQHLNYNRDKGLDFVARFNGKYVIGEAKFLSAQGGSQNSDFEDAMATLEAKDVNAVGIAILDGILYLEGRSKMYRAITNPYKDRHIMSALVLREFLYQI